MTVKNLFKFIFNNLNNKMIGGVYLIQPTELIGTNRYKIGCSYKRSLEERIRTGYHSRTKKILLCPSNNAKEVEKEIIKQFNKKRLEENYPDRDINNNLEEIMQVLSSTYYYNTSQYHTGDTDEEYDIEKEHDYQRRHGKVQNI